jgi:hypothetical protein
MAKTIAGTRPGRGPVIKTAPQELAGVAPDNSSPASSLPNYMAEASLPNIIPEASAAKSDTSAIVEGNGPPPRRKRNPFGTHEQKLAYPPRPGYHRHWFNDVSNRIPQALEGGYTHVVGNDGKRVMRPAGVAEHGGALIAYLLEIPQAWYDEDMAAQQAEVDKVEEAMRRGVDTKGGPGVDGRYIPAQGIKIEHRTGTAR